MSRSRLNKAIFSIVLVSACTFAGATATATSTSSDKPKKGILLLPTKGARPELLLWKTQDRPTVATQILKETTTIALTPGQGWIVAVRPANAPLCRKMTIEPGATVRLAPLNWSSGVVLRGTVLGTDHLPLRATVTADRVHQHAEKPEMNLCQKALEEAAVSRKLTDDDGRFAVGPVAPGRIKLMVSRPGFVVSTQEVVVDAGRQERDVGAITLHAEARLELDFDLSEVEEGFPFKLSLQRENEGWINQADEWKTVESRSVDSDEPVHFVVAPGYCRVVLSKEGSQLFFVQPLQLVAGENSFILKPWAIDVSGKVTDSDGPVSKVTVTFSFAGHETKAVSSHEGRYEARLWAPGHYGVFATAPDGRRYMTGADFSEARPGDEVDVPIDLPSGRVAGVVVDRDNGGPVPEARAVLVQNIPDGNASTTRSTVADDEGRFEFKGARDGKDIESIVKVDAAEYLPTSVEVDPAEESSSHLRIELAPANTAKGKVIGPGAEPVPGAIIGCCAATPTSDLSSTAVSEGDGSFQLDAATGNVVYAVARGYTVGWTTITSLKKDTVIALRARAYPVTLRVLDDEDEPVSGVALTFSLSGSDVIPFSVITNDSFLNNGMRRTDTEGRIVVSYLPPGYYRVWLLTRSGTLALGAVVVPTSGEMELHVPTE